MMTGPCQGQRGYKLTNYRRLRGSKYVRVREGERKGEECSGGKEGKGRDGGRNKSKDGTKDKIKEGTEGETGIYEDMKDFLEWKKKSLCMTYFFQVLSFRY